MKKLFVTLVILLLAPILAAAEELNYAEFTIGEPLLTYSAPLGWETEDIISGSRQGRGHYSGSNYDSSNGSYTILVVSIPADKSIREFLNETYYSLTKNSRVFKESDNRSFIFNGDFYGIKFIGKLGEPKLNTAFEIITNGDIAISVTYSDKSTNYDKKFAAVEKLIESIRFLPISEDSASISYSTIDWDALTDDQLVFVKAKVDSILENRLPDMPTPLSSESVETAIPLATTEAPSPLQETILNSNVEADLGDYHVVIKEASYAKDKDDSDCIIVDFEWAHQKNESQTFMWSFDYKAYQNGIELDQSFFIDLKYDNDVRNLKRGASLPVQIAWILDDRTTPVEVEIGILFENDSISKLFSNIR